MTNPAPSGRAIGIIIDMIARPHPTVSVAIICMTSGPHLARCLASLHQQRGAASFDITVVSGPHVGDLRPIERRFPGVRFVTNEGQRSPLELASRALRESQGELILLTKDHCEPAPDWVKVMVEASQQEVSAVGGLVEAPSDASTTDWAYHFIDFFRYAGGRRSGIVQSLSVCNVCYRRRDLELIRQLWQDEFVETVVNRALVEQCGVLWLESGSRVTMHVHLTLSQALRERYASGRLFAFSRLRSQPRTHRALYALGAPALPLVFLGRMGAAAARSQRSRRLFARAFVPLVLLVFARCWGEWLAYLTGRPGASTSNRA